MSCIFKLKWDWSSVPRWNEQRSDLSGTTSGRVFFSRWLPILPYEKTSYNCSVLPVLVPGITEAISTQTKASIIFQSAFVIPNCWWIKGVRQSEDGGTMVSIKRDSSQQVETQRASSSCKFDYSLSPVFCLCKANKPLQSQKQKQTTHVARWLHCTIADSIMFPYWPNSPQQALWQPCCVILPWLPLSSFKDVFIHFLYTTLWLLIIIIIFTLLHVTVLPTSYMVSRKWHQSARPKHASATGLFLEYLIWKNVFRRLII